MAQLRDYIVRNTMWKPQRMITFTKQDVRPGVVSRRILVAPDEIQLMTNLHRLQY
jgi:hypothetical protein